MTDKSPVQLDLVKDTALSADYPESFAEYPESIAEAKAFVLDSAALWKPRDLLLSVLRDIDAGTIAPTAMIVVMQDENAPNNSYVNATQSQFQAIGMLEMAKLKMAISAR